MPPQPHESHPDIIKRLNRARGHLQSVTQMIEEGRPCLAMVPRLLTVAARTPPMPYRLLKLAEPYA